MRSEAHMLRRIEEVLEVGIVCPDPDRRLYSARLEVAGERLPVGFAGDVVDLVASEELPTGLRIARRGLVARLAGRGELGEDEGSLLHRVGEQLRDLERGRNRHLVAGVRERLLHTRTTRERGRDGKGGDRRQLASDTYLLL